MFTKEDMMDLLHQCFFKTEAEKQEELELRKQGKRVYVNDTLVNNFEVFVMLRLPGNQWLISDKSLMKYEWESQALHVAKYFDTKARSVSADNVHIFIRNHLDSSAPLVEVRNGQFIYEQKGGM